GLPARAPSLPVSPALLAGGGYRELLRDQVGLRLQGGHLGRDGFLPTEERQLRPLRLEAGSLSALARRALLRQTRRARQNSRGPQVGFEEPDAFRAHHELPDLVRVRHA